MARLHISESVLARPLDEKTVLLNLDTGMCYAVSGVAVQMWTLLREGEDTETIVAQLLAEYDVESEVLRRDLNELIERLVGSGLARRESGGAV